MMSLGYENIDVTCFLDFIFVLFCIQLLWKVDHTANPAQFLKPLVRMLCHFTELFRLEAARVSPVQPVLQSYRIVSLWNMYNTFHYVKSQWSLPGLKSLATEESCTFYIRFIFHLENLDHFHSVPLPVAWEQLLKPYKLLQSCSHPLSISFPTICFIHLGISHLFMCFSLGESCLPVGLELCRWALLHPEPHLCFLNLGMCSQDMLSVSAFNFLFVSPLSHMI